MKKKIIGYVIAFVVALTVVLLVCGLNGLLTEQKSAQDTAKILCDAFFRRVCTVPMLLRSYVGIFKGSVRRTGIQRFDVL